MLIGNLFKYWTYQLFSPETVLKEKYAAFKSLLTHDKRSHELMAELEEIYYNHQKMDFSAIEKLCSELSLQVAGIVDDLSKVCPACYPDLLFYHKKIDSYIRFMTTPKEAVVSPPYALRLDETGPEDLGLVGGKALNLGIVKKILGHTVPEGFVITTNAYHRFMEANHLRKEIDHRMSTIDINDTASLSVISGEIRNLIVTARVPPEIKAEITEYHRSMALPDKTAPGVAVRSSAVGEDSQASFAGQYMTALNVKKENLVKTYQEIIASKYSPEAIYYRINYGFLDSDTPMAVLVLNMIDAVTSGVMYTGDLGNSESGNLKIHAIWGLGELLVGGQTPADIVTVSKEPSPRIIDKLVALKPLQIVYSPDVETKSIPVEELKQKALSIDDRCAEKLAEWGLALEKYYGKPQDIEWCIDRSGNIFILQSRPLRTGVPRSLTRPECDFSDVRNEILVSGGERAAYGIGSGKVFQIKNESDIDAVPDGSVLVAGDASPKYVKVMNRLSAVVTDTGSSAGHFASVAREFGVPTLVNTRNASTVLDHGQAVTVHADGRTVYAGTVTQMLESPCAKANLIVDSPYMRKLRYIMKFVSTLDLVDPDHKSFTPQHCRSFHDIIRFSHEKVVQEMFHISDNRLRKLSLAKKLASTIPMQFYVLDVGGGLTDDSKQNKEVRIDDVQNKAMHALWTGLTHPDIPWGAFNHFDWEAHDRIVMSGGIASPKSTMFASHAVISAEYMNLNLRFGYHFVIVDALCGGESLDNSILFRFSGGGADLAQRMLRATFLKQVLNRLDFNVTVKSDLVDGQLKGADIDTNLQRLEMIGRLLGASRLMDMYLKDASMIEGFVDDFMQGRYHFASFDVK